MKSSTSLVLFAVFAGEVLALSITDSPIDKVVTLIDDLKAKVIADGKQEQASFDEYACWCEKTLDRKAAAISASKELIAETEILIQKLKGEIASHGAEIMQLKKDIAANLASQKEATEMRNKQYEEYHEEKTEAEQCIGALEAAVKVLTGAGAAKNFLDTSAHKAQLLAVASQMSTVLRKDVLPHAVSQAELQLLRNFVTKPEEFVAHHIETMSAAQVAQNPFGDYAPQSTQIQGILKGMYDAFTADLEKDNAAEAESQKSYEELMATKKQEEKTLELTLQKQEGDEAEKTKKMKESEALRDDTVEQLKADEAFFADTKESCKTKAEEWAVRTRLRTEELNGMIHAMKILSSESAKKTFENATTTFLQVVSINKHHVDNGAAAKAFAQLKGLATRFQSVKLAKIAAILKVGGHFDKVIKMIDDMIALLRKEEASDIVHRDLCENSQNANKNELADISHQIDKADEMKKRLENTKGETESEISAVDGDIADTKKNQEELLDMRNKEEAEFKQALKDDTAAVALIREAITALTKFYKENKIPLELAQDPEYTHDPDKAPETSWSGSDYGGRKGESKGIISILSMIAEDLENEMHSARSDDAKAQAEYEKQNAALQKTLDAQEDTKVGLEEELAATEEKIDATEAYKKAKSDDEAAEGDQKKALGADCAWVKTHFETRREKRKNEIQGLVDAKGFLAGVDAGEDPLPLN